MDTKNKKKKPLLYVEQSNLPSPPTSMQTTYSSKQEKTIDEDINVKSEQDEQTDVAEKKENIQHIIEEYEESHSEETQGFQRVKSFKDMNVQERIDYLLHFPKQLPPVPCLFISDDKHIRGFVELKQGNELMIKTLSGSMQTIHIGSIKSVKMVGFR